MKAHIWVGLLCLLLGLIPSDASAHAELITTSPENGAELEVSPTEILLEFSEPVGAVEDGFRLHSESGEPVSLNTEPDGNTIVIPIQSPLEDGAYIVQWRVISADSHPISGTISFAVGDVVPGSEIQIGSELPGWVQWATTAAKALSYGGLLLTLGLLAVGWMLVRPEMDVVAGLVQKAASIAAVGLLLEFPLSAITQRGSTVQSLSEMWTALQSVDRNTGWSIGAGIALMIAVGLAARGDLRDRDLFFMVVILNVTAVLSLLLSGHTRTKSPAWLMLTGDAVHLMAGAVWLGGITILVLGLTGRWKGNSFKASEDAIAATSRFSRMAMWVAIAIIASGVAMATAILDSWDALLNTNYGTTLIIKVGLVVFILVIAAVNRFILLPGRERSLSWLRRLVSVELVVLLAVVGITGFLVQQNPTVPSQQIAQPESIFYDTVALDATHSLDIDVSLQADRSLVIQAVVRGENGEQVIPEADLVTTWFLPAQQLGPLEFIIPLDLSTGNYHGEVEVPRSGEWEVEVRVRIDRFTDSRTTVLITLPE